MSKILNTHVSDLSEALMFVDAEEYADLVRILRLVRENGGTVYVFGNGGSHTTAAHFANDLMKMARVKAVCVGDLAATALAYGNDDGWQRMFQKPVARLVAAGDCLFGISCGGSSDNVNYALDAAEYSIADEMIYRMGLTGPDRNTQINRLKLDGLVHVMANDIRVIEDVHLVLCHAMIRELQHQD